MNRGRQLGHFPPRNAAICTAALPRAAACGPSGWVPRTPIRNAALRRSATENPQIALSNLGAFLAVALYLQLFLGAVVRHTGHAFLAHLLGAGFVFLIVGRLAYVAFGQSDSGELNRVAGFLIGLLFLQLMLGLGAFVMKFRPTSLDFWQVIFSTGHVACGALMLAAALIYFLRTRPQLATS